MRKLFLLIAILLAPTGECAKAKPPKDGCITDLFAVAGSPSVRPTRIISGGQTGADRAGLDVSQELGIPRGGWCPRGRLSEDADGTIPTTYALQETPSRDYPQRTQWNVRDSDATLILSFGKPGRGTKLTIREATSQGKPFLLVDISKPVDVPQIREWLRANNVRTLNIAGSREGSDGTSVHARARQVLLNVFAEEE